ncbi:MAG: hypothetical protein NDI61_01865 [Bdellovibrionaceae bacterium]|nr:hypothetical protein [Pseudobdellovibrionaceae bacterium]
MNDSWMLIAFVLIYLLTGIGLMALVGALEPPRLAKVHSRKPVPLKGRDKR